MPPWKKESTGGGQRYTFEENDISMWIVPGFENRLAQVDGGVYHYVNHINTEIEPITAETHLGLIPVRMPLHDLVINMNMTDLLQAVRVHGIKGFVRNTHIDMMRQALQHHDCKVCPHAVTLLKSVRKRKAPSKYATVIEEVEDVDAPAAKRKPKVRAAVRDYEPQMSGSTARMSRFPPEPITDRTRDTIIEEWCDAHNASNLQEVGCTVCGQLVKIRLTQVMPVEGLDLSGLHANSDFTRLERFSVSEPVKPLTGPVLDARCDRICDDCRVALEKGKVPMMALANGLWLGDVPDELQDLYYAEKLLIAKIRHNRCVVRVKSGMHKMHANAITFANPTVHVYDTLPPPRSEMDDVISFIFVGPCKPTKKDLERTPLMIRRVKVARALEWLKLNNEYYADLIISYENLNQYTDYGCPVSIAYRETEDVRDPSTQSADNDGEEEGTSDGRCSLVIQGLVGGDFGNKTWDEMTAIAVEHLAKGGSSMAVSHHESPQSIYHNPGLYPQMFPWLSVPYYISYDNIVPAIVRNGR
ncbi:hypothetical protein HWV62_2631 [Athelia sp. TMB]|nr:hypothetical protein HWV62_2631 [Athelia sp. TMB]